MKVIIDDKIPFIRDAAEKMFSNVVYLPGDRITASDVKDADALIIRTRTRCDQSLLNGSAVRFIVTATIGYDHLDIDYLSKTGITWTNCPGCNASSVGQYIESCLILLKRQKLLPASPVIGIVGLGHVGNQVAMKVKSLGYKLLFNDPPRQEREDEVDFCNMKEIAEICDVITFHTPLTFTGRYKTWHLADNGFFNSLERKPIIINAARGGVVDERELHKAYINGRISAYILDTWENEPHIAIDVMNDAFIATPHIAGYSADGKCNATKMALKATCDFFGIKPEFNIMPPLLPNNMVLEGNKEEQKLQLYNPCIDNDRLKMHPENFEKLRSNYPLRRESW